MAKIAADVPGSGLYIYYVYPPYILYVWGLTSCLLLRVFCTFLLRCFLFLFLAAHAASWPAAAAGGAAEQPDCAIYNFAAVYQGIVCALYLFKSHTHTHTGTLAYPLWPGTPCGMSWGRQARCPPLPYRSPLPGLASWHGNFSSFPPAFLLGWKIV